MTLAQGTAGGLLPLLHAERFRVTCERAAQFWVDEDSFVAPGSLGNTAGELRVEDLYSRVQASGELYGKVFIHHGPGVHFGPIWEHHTGFDLHAHRLRCEILDSGGDAEGVPCLTGRTPSKSKSGLLYILRRG